MNELYSGVDFYADADTALRRADGVPLNCLHGRADDSRVARAFHLERYLVGNRKRGIRLVIDFADAPENTSLVTELEQLPEINSELLCWIGLSRTVHQQRSDRHDRGLIAPENSRFLEVSQREQGSIEYFMGDPLRRINALEQFATKTQEERDEFLNAFYIRKTGTRDQAFADGSCSGREQESQKNDGRCGLHQHPWMTSWSRKV
ncbi:TPA: hypothetical protein EYO12_03370 [Candidatus Saccharibacteria bacterium]|nr:hypothetical protein [Candidatus Saccharibacteria bacterium]HIO87927.1 hypothetical protein [Candidatus Saccharibacteria bacterium]